MTTAAVLPRRTTTAQQRRLTLVGLLVVELVLFALLATRLVQVRDVEDRREIVGDVETIHFRREVAGDPGVVVLLALGLVAPALSGRLRREPVLLVATQAVIVGLTMFVLWPLGQVFVEGFRAGPLAEGFSLLQFERLLETPM